MIGHRSTALRVGTATIAAAATLILVLACATLVFVARTAIDAQRSADNIADCTTPGGVCYQRNVDGTAGAVRAILDRLDALAADRRRGTANLATQHTQILGALHQLCAAQHLTCNLPKETP